MTKEEALVESDLLNDIGVMMSEFVDNWPQPKRVETALALIAKTLRAALGPQPIADDALVERLANAKFALEYWHREAIVGGLPSRLRGPYERGLEEIGKIDAALQAIHEKKG